MGQAVIIPCVVTIPEETCCTIGQAERHRQAHSGHSGQGIQARKQQIFQSCIKLWRLLVARIDIELLLAYANVYLNKIRNMLFKKEGPRAQTKYLSVKQSYIILSVETNFSCPYP